MKKQLKKYLSMLLAFVMVCSCFPAMPMEAEETSGSEKRYSWDFQDAAQAEDFDLLSTVSTNKFFVENGTLTTGDAKGSYMKAISKENYSVSSISVDVSPISETTPLDAHVLLGVTGTAQAQPHQNDMIDIRWEDSGATSNSHALKVYAVTENTRNVIFNQWLGNSDVLYSGNNAQAVNINIEVIDTKLIFTVSLLSNMSKYKQYIIDITEDLYTDDGIAPAMDSSRLQGRFGFAVDGWNGSFACFDNVKIVEKVENKTGVWDFENATQANDFEYVKQANAGQLGIETSTETNNSFMATGTWTNRSGYTKAILKQGYNARSISVDIHPGDTELLDAWLWIGVKGDVGDYKNTKGQALAIQWRDANPSQSSAAMYVWATTGANATTKIYDGWINNGQNVYENLNPEPINMKVDIDGTNLLITVSSINDKSQYKQWIVNLESAGLNDEILIGRAGIGSLGWQNDGDSTASTARFDNLTIVEKDAPEIYDFDYSAQLDVDNSKLSLYQDNTTGGNLSVDVSTGYLTPGVTSNGMKQVFSKQIYDKNTLKSLSVDIHPITIDGVNQPINAEIYFGIQGDGFSGNNYHQTLRLYLGDTNSNTSGKTFKLYRYGETKANVTTLKDGWSSINDANNIYTTMTPQSVNITINIRGTIIGVKTTALATGKSGYFEYDVEQAGYTTDIFEGKVGLCTYAYVSGSDSTARAQFDNLTISSYNTEKDKGGHEFSASEQWVASEKLAGVPNTVEAWVNVPKTVTNDEKGTILSGQPSLASVDLRMTTYGRPCFTWRDKDGNKQQLIANGVDLRTGKWTHVAAVRDDANQTLTIFVNGEAVATKTGTSVADIDLYKLYIGRNNSSSFFFYDGVKNQYPFIGKVADVRVWSSPRTQAQIVESMWTESMTQEDELLLDLKLDTTNTSGIFEDSSKYANHLENDVRAASASELDWQEITQTGVEDGGYSVVIVPDQQILSNYHPEKLNKIYQWIADNVETENIQYVLNVGDLADTDATLEKDFKASQDAYNLIKEKVPMAFVPGNHDYDSTGGFRDTSVMNQYFPLSIYDDVDTFGGSYDGEKTDNTWHEFTVNGNQYLIMALEYGPRDSVLNWASDVIEAHPYHQVIVMTHGHLNWDETLLSNATRHAATYSAFLKGTNEEAPNAADAVWNKLISKHDNIIMTLSGHIPWDNVVYRTDKGANNNDIIQMLVDGQGLDADFGGVGLLGIMRFNADGTNVSFNYFSPLQGEKGMNLGTDNQFTFTLPTPTNIRDLEEITVGGIKESKIYLKDKDTLPTGKETIDGKYILEWTLDGETVTAYDSSKAGYVAKVVDPEMLDVMWQENTETAGTDANTYKVRFIGSLDNYEDYKSAGFVFIRDKYYTPGMLFEIPDSSDTTSKIGKVSVKKLYTKLLAEGKDVSPATQYGSDYSQYFFAYEMSGIAEDLRLYTRAYVELSNGDIVYGDINNICIADWRN